MPGVPFLKQIYQHLFAKEWMFPIFIARKGELPIGTKGSGRGRGWVRNREDLGTIF